VGAIGVGRISRAHDLPNILRYDIARVMAVCDLDANRVEDGKTFINDFYAKQSGQTYNGVAGYGRHQDLLANKDVDAVVISTPDHWHALIAIAAVQAGKDVYLQKPASLTIAEGRALSNAVHQSGRIFQIGSQQRSTVQFRYAAELVRNGRIGQLKTVEVGLPGDPSGDVEPEMPVPRTLNYETWLGSTPYVYYTERRVHPQTGYDRPGWLRCEQFGAGMITGWGAHHVDSAHWGMGTEYTGPIEVWGTAVFPTKGLWDVHGDFKTYGLYANGVTMVISGEFPNGIKFIGTDGWIFVSRGNEAVTGSDPVAKLQDNTALASSDPKIITSVIGPNELHLYESTEHHLNWLESIRSRREPIAPVEIAHRSCSTCLLHHIAMKTSRRLHWDPIKERFKDDDAANALLSRPMRAPYTL
jgi:predicted dehydrogenase